MRIKYILLMCFVLLILGYSSAILMLNDPNNINYKMYNALTIGSRGNLEYVKECINNGANLNRVYDNYGKKYNPLLIAIENNNFNIINYFVNNGADLNHFSKNRTILMHLLKNNNLSDKRVADVLLSKGASINLKNVLGLSALDYAVYEGNYNAVKYLLLNNAKITNKTFRMLTKYHDNENYIDLNILKTILNAAVAQNINIHSSSLIKACVYNDVGYFLKRVKDNNLSNKDVSIIFALCNIDVINIISTNIYNSENYLLRLFKISVINGNMDGLLYIRNIGLDINSITLSQILIDSIRYNHYNMVKYILYEYDVSFTLTNSPTSKSSWVVSNNIIDEIIKNDYKDLLNLIFKYNYPVNTETISHAIHCAIQYKNNDMLKLIFENEIDVNYIDTHVNRTFLSASSFYSNYFAAKYFIDNGADVNGIADSIPLSYAVLRGDEEIIKLLIDNGADVNKIEHYNDGSNGTPYLYTAVADGNLEIVRLLIQYGVNVDEVNSSKKTTALIKAASTSYNILKYLIDNNANINYQNENGETALMIAKISKNYENVKLLIESGDNM